jgi:2-polyprenyl-3-methyl-5-hydroxy-6-metoxy-1,4-benzoquinol methylase
MSIDDRSPDFDPPLPTLQESLEEPAKNQGDFIEKVRQQFEFEPYPYIPIERSPQAEHLLLYSHNWITPYYLQYRQIPRVERPRILDVGCGSGYTTLCLAYANPGAEIVAIDLSPKSVEMAQQRLQYHGFSEVEFHALAIENLPQLGLSFDYINCDEVLYLLQDPVQGLASMQSVLKPQGIVRANLHNALQRSGYFRIQNILKTMGFLKQNPQEEEMLDAVKFIQSLDNAVELKGRVFPSFLHSPNKKEFILANYLLQGDKGYSVPECFEILEKAGLQFINMVNWREWNILSLFQSSPPDRIIKYLATLTIEQYLHFYEQLNPVHRLLDFWACSRGAAPPPKLIRSWTQRDWEVAKVQLHPQLNRPEVKRSLLDSLKGMQPFPLTPHLPLSKEHIILDCLTAACLLPLFDGEQSMWTIVQRWQQLNILDLVTLELNSAQKAFESVQQILSRLEHSGYLLLTTAE